MKACRKLNSTRGIAGETVMTTIFDTVSIVGRSVRADGSDFAESFDFIFAIPKGEK